MDNHTPDALLVSTQRELLAVCATEAARLCGISTSHFYGLLASGRCPPGFRLGRRRLWLVSELQNWLASGAPNAERWNSLKGAKQ